MSDGVWLPRSGMQTFEDCSSGTADKQVIQNCLYAPLDKIFNKNNCSIPSFDKLAPTCVPFVGCFRICFLFFDGLRDLLLAGIVRFWRVPLGQLSQHRDATEVSVPPLQMRKSASLLQSFPLESTCKLSCLTFQDYAR